MDRVKRLNVTDLQRWQQQLAHVEALSKVVRDRTPTPQDGTDLLKCELRRAAIATVLPNSQAELYEAIALATGGAQLALLTQHHWRRYEDDHQIALIEPSTPERKSPIGSAHLDWPAWIRALCVALIARDANTVNLLCTPESIEACAIAANTIDAFWPFLCSTLAATVVEPTAAGPVLADTLAGLSQATIAESTLIEFKLRPLVVLIEALLSNQVETFNLALHSALTAHRQYHEQSDTYDWQPLLALEITALAALATDRGLSLTVESDYMPTALLTGNFPCSLSQVIDYFPQRGILSANEAHWFLDLQGFPRQARSHTLLDSNGQLIAQYKAYGAPTIPHAVLPFVLLDSPPADMANPVSPLALDAGQLVALAETFASRLPADILPAQHSTARALLSEAIDCIDAAIARILPGQSAIAADGLTSPQGRALYQSEPGRFRRDRLAAYRSGLSSILQSLEDSDLIQTVPIAISQTTNALETDILKIESPESTAQTVALAAIEVIQAQIMPLLEAIGKDKTGRIVKQLIPTETDYQKVFADSAIEIALAGYRNLWKSSRSIKRPSSDQTEILCHLAPAGMLQTDNVLSAPFPGGYRAIAQHLNPHRIWASWQYRIPGQPSGLSFNGLVWLGDRWVWFPKPYRILRK